MVRAIHRRLHDVGYTDLPTPLKIAGVQFDFTAAMRGRDGRALDLILLVDTNTGEFGDRDGGRVRQRVEALSRALDVTGSRYVVTVILAGAVLADGVESLSEICRVLSVEGIELDANGAPKDKTAAQQLDDRVRVLLPLTLPPLPEEPQVGILSTMDQLIKVLPSSTSKALVDAAIGASAAGELAVTEAVSEVIGAVFKREDEEGE